MDELTIVVCEPGKAPYVSKVRKDLQAMQQLVGGPLEMKRVTDMILLLFNEEGLLMNLPYNRTIGAFSLVGTVFFVGDASPEFCSLTEDNIQCISKHILKEEIQLL